MSKKTRDEHEHTFWQPTADLMTALLLILLLVVALLLLYLRMVPEHDRIDDYVGDAVSEASDDGEVTPTPTITPTPTPHPDDNDGGGGGGGGGGDDGDGEEEGDDEHEEPGEFESEGEKSAVMVMLVDGDTGKTIKEAGVTFELYAGRSGIQTLHTYYPDKVTYRNFETTEAGTFFLPEKIYQGNYYLKETTEATGYGLAENEEFDLDDYYDWDDPFVVKVPVLPVQNHIRLHMTDADTDKAIEGGTFDVVASEDIRTLDGTLRYKKGETVGEIVCNEEGYGESEELFLGEYTLKEKDIPEYYASIGETLSATVAGKKGVDMEMIETKSEKTSFAVKVTDELYQDTPLAGIEFSVTDDAGNETVMKTDESGSFSMEDLDKNTTYHIVQKTSLDDYKADTKEHTVTVSKTGRIKNETHADVAITNRLIRAKIGVTDAILKNQVAGLEMSLTNKAGEEVEKWTTGNVPAEFEGLKAGTYKLIVDGDDENPYTVKISDTAELQDTMIEIYTMWSYLAIGGAALGGLAVLLILYAIIRHIRKKRKAKKEAAKQE